MAKTRNPGNSKKRWTPHPSKGKPDAGFLMFYNTEFHHRIERETIPGMEGASWDRRAAHMLWRAEGRDKKA